MRITTWMPAPFCVACRLHDCVGENMQKTIFDKSIRPDISVVTRFLIFEVVAKQNEGNLRITFYATPQLSRRRTPNLVGLTPIPTVNLHSFVSPTQDCWKPSMPQGIGVSFWSASTTYPQTAGL